ncbi:MAG: hypothetical protein KJ808_04655 [Acidobacteria bacterium]|nr:hypothetical protein [Acidobacteriota bacterium]MBU4307650.1 hypothetical protein [Acidobacteriota bacterium]MCG2810454.1 hypothetical protein [Candidatus Aminicenantes bacterium]
MKIVAISLALMLTAVTGFAVSDQITKIHDLTFVSTLELSVPEPAGLDALLIVHPKDAKSGVEKMSITAVRFPADAVGAGGMSDAELLEYVKTVFLATSRPGTPVERTFLARKVLGEALEKSIPTPARAEVYVVSLKTGAKVVLGFVFAPDFAAQAGQVIAEVAASLRED